MLVRSVRTSHACKKSGNVETKVSHADEISSDSLSPTFGTHCNAVFTLEQRFKVFYNYFSIIGCC